MDIRTSLVKALGRMSIAQRRDIAKLSGVPYNTVHKYSYEYNAPHNGRYDTMSRLLDAIGKLRKPERRNWART